MGLTILCILMLTETINLYDKLYSNMSLEHRTCLLFVSHKKVVFVVMNRPILINCHEFELYWDICIAVTHISCYRNDKNSCSFFCMYYIIACRHLYITHLCVPICPMYSGCVSAIGRYWFQWVGLRISIKHFCSRFGDWWRYMGLSAETWTMQTLHLGDNWKVL